MLKYICKKLAFLVVLLLLISIVVFVAIRLVPGDPVVAMLGSEVAGMSEEYLEYERERLGLNDPMYIQYFRLSSTGIRLPSRSRCSPLGWRPYLG